MLELLHKIKCENKRKNKKKQKTKKKQAIPEENEKRENSNSSEASAIILNPDITVDVISDPKIISYTDNDTPIKNNIKKSQNSKHNNIIQISEHSPLNDENMTPQNYNEKNNNDNIFNAYNNNNSNNNNNNNNDNLLSMKHVRGDSNHARAESANLVDYMDEIHKDIDIVKSPGKSDTLRSSPATTLRSRGGSEALRKQVTNKNNDVIEYDSSDNDNDNDD